MDAFAETLAAQALVRAIPVETLDVYCWRVEQLEQAGYSDAIAHVLAENAQVDLHAACGLIARGCPEHLAYEILT
jgi:hypothetical protein